MEAPADIAKTGTVTLRFTAGESQQFQRLRVLGKDSIAADKYEALRKEAVALLPRGFAGTLSMMLGADMRYVGQGYSIEVIFRDLSPGDLTAERVSEAFTAAYRAMYGRT